MLTLQTSITARGWTLGALFMLMTLPALAEARNVRIDAPASTVAGRAIEVSFIANTEAGQGERVGFLHAEFSSDGGKTWTPLCYLEDVGAEITRVCTVKAGPAGTTLRLRVRVAFRGGLAGDVDYAGAAIRWKDTWENWSQPPAMFAVIAVRKG